MSFDWLEKPKGSPSNWDAIPHCNRTVRVSAATHRNGPVESPTQKLIQDVYMRPKLVVTDLQHRQNVFCDRSFRYFCGLEWARWIDYVFDQNGPDEEFWKW
jgi:hypothetical protein